MMLVLVIVALLTHLPSMSSPAAWRPPRKMMIGPLTPAGAKWMCDCEMAAEGGRWRGGGSLVAGVWGGLFGWRSCVMSTACGVDVVPQLDLCVCIRGLVELLLGCE